MKILDVKFRWNEQFSNAPQVMCLVDEYVDRDSLVYEKAYDSLDGCFYYAESPDGFVDFYYHTPHDMADFCGRTYTVRTKDGLEKLRGPWASRPAIANSHGFGPCMDVLFGTSRSEWKKGNAVFAGAFTVAIVKAALPKGIVVWEDWWSDEGSIFTVGWEDGRIKPSIQPGSGMYDKDGKPVPEWNNWIWRQEQNTRVDQNGDRVRVRRPMMFRDWQSNSEQGRIVCS